MCNSKVMLSRIQTDTQPGPTAIIVLASPEVRGDYLILYDMIVNSLLPALSIAISFLIGSVPSSQTADITERYLYVTLRSEACDDQGRFGCGNVAMEVNGRVINLPFAGYNILAFSETTGDESARGHFDIRVAGNGQKMAQFIKTDIPSGSIVLVAVGESGKTLNTAEGYALRLIGAVPPLNLKLRETWAFIGYKHRNWAVRRKPWIQQMHSPRYQGPTIITSKIPLKDICTNKQATCPKCQVPVKCKVDPCKDVKCRALSGANCIVDECGHCGDCVPIFVFYVYPNVKIDCDYLHIRVISAGCEDPGLIGCGRAHIEIWNRDYSRNQRGHNVVVIDSRSGNVDLATWFDTYGDPQSGEKLKDLLAGLSSHKIVVIATSDSANNYENDAHEELRRLGAGDPLDAGRRGSWVLVSRKGCRPPWFRQAWNKRREGPTEVIVDVPLIG